MSKKWKWGIGLSVIVIGLTIATFLGATDATWKLVVKPGLTIGDIWYADRKDRVTNLNASASGKFLRAAGTATAPAWSTLILPNAASTGDIPYASSTNTYTALADVAAGAYMRSGGVKTAPLWSTLLLPNAATTGDLIQATATNSIATLSSGPSSSYLRGGGTATANAWSTLILPNAATTGGIPYGSATNTYAELAAGANGTVLQAAGATTAPAYIAKNIMRIASHNFATLAASWTLSADDALCYYLLLTNANAACTIRAPETTGLTFIIRNDCGSNATILGTSGITVATAKTAHVYHDGTDYVRATADQTH